MIINPTLPEEHVRGLLGRDDRYTVIVPYSDDIGVV